jgi:hypothetical protein
LRLYADVAPRRRAKAIGAEFKPGSSDHWRWLLFGREEEGALGLAPISYTAKKKARLGEEWKDCQVDDDVIEELQRAYPDMEILKARVDLQQLSHTKAVVGAPADADGRCRAAFSQHRTETQRLASGKDDDEDDKVRRSGAGNMQNKKDLERSIYCAGSEEFVFFEWDLKQIELEVMAWHARDLPLIRDLRSGVDVHAQNAAAVFGCEATKEATSALMVHFEGRMQPARQAGKKFTHRANYGGGDKNAGKMYQPCAKWSLQELVDFIVERWIASDRREGVSPQTIKRLCNGGAAEHARLREYANTLVAKGWRVGYFKRRPGLLAYQNDLIARAERDGYLINSFGYKLKFWNFERKEGKRVLKDREEALAFVPQSDVAFMSKVILRHEGEMDACCAKHGGELLFQNHDAFGGRIPRKSLENFHADSRPIVEREWPELGTLPEFGMFRSRADFMVGWNWGKQHKHSEKCGAPRLAEFPWAERECGKIENVRGLVGWSA